MSVTTKHKQRGANTVLRYELKVKYCGRERREGYFSVTPLPPPSPHGTVQAVPNKYRAWRMVIVKTLSTFPVQSNNWVAFVAEDEGKTDLFQ